MSAVTTPIEGEVAFRNYAASTFGSNTIIVGIDEVGRGPLAGPVVACAAVLKSPDVLPVLNDSKKFTRPKREAIYDKVKDACLCYAIASASVEEIDSINILEADFLAMRRALQALGMPGVLEKDILEMFDNMPGPYSLLMEHIRDHSDEERRYMYAKFALSQIGFTYATRKGKSGWYLQNSTVRYIASKQTTSLKVASCFV